MKLRYGMFWRSPDGDGGAGGGGGSNEPTITVTVDGKEITVPKPKGVLLESEFHDRFSRELSRRTASLATKAIDDLFGNPDELAKVAEKRGLKLVDPSASRGDGTGKPNADAIAELRKSVEKELVEPLKSKLTEREKQLERFRDRTLVGEILGAAAEAGVKDAFRKKNASGVAPIVAMYRDAFGYDEESGAWYVRNAKGDGFAFSANPTDDSPYKTVAEFFAELAADKTSGEFFGTTGATGPGAKPGGGTARTGADVRISRADASIRSKYVAAVEAAKKTGGKVVIVE